MKIQFLKYNTHFSHYSIYLKKIVCIDKFLIFPNKTLLCLFIDQTAIINALLDRSRACMLPAHFWQRFDILMAVVSMLGVHFGIGSDTLMDVKPVLPEQLLLMSVTLTEESPFASRAVLVGSC